MPSDEGDGARQQPGAASGGPARAAGREVSFMIWLIEVEDVISEALRIGASLGERALAERIDRELRTGCERAQERAIPRKAFPYTPAPELSSLAALAVSSARRGGPVRVRRGPAESANPHGWQVH